MTLPGFLPETVDRVRSSTSALGTSTTAFAKAISKVFADATAGGKQFDDVLKQLALRLSNMTLGQMLPRSRPILGAGASRATRRQGKLDRLTGPPVLSPRSTHFSAAVPTSGTIERWFCTTPHLRQVLAASMPS